MKGLLSIFVEQFRTKEIWKRVWELNRFKKFINFKEYRWRVSRVLTKEDVPSIIMIMLIGIAIIAALSVFFKDRNLSLAIISSIVLFRVLQAFADTFRKDNKDKNEDKT